MAQLVIFLDDGGVMNDNSRRAAQWQHLISEFFVPLLGGTFEAWIEANRVVIDNLFDSDNWHRRMQAASDYVSFNRSYQIDWLEGMCELVGVATPLEEECVELAHRATMSIISQVRTAFPGVVDAIRTLRCLGYTLHTASSEPSIELAGYLDGMGVRGCFGHSLYGPDLIDTFKIGTAYYERIFAEVGVTPSNALVVDDSPHAVDWAAQVGARTVLVSSSQYSETRAIRCIGSLAELPGIIHQLG